VAHLRVAACRLVARFARPLLWGFFALVVAVLFYRYLYKDGDFDIYWAGTFRFLHALQIHVQEIHPFSYPTFATFLLLPLYPLGYSAAKVVFFVLNVIILVAALRVCHREILDGSRYRVAAIAITLVFSVRSMLAVFNNQQSDILIFGLIVFGLSACCRRPIGGMGLVAVAAALKANPLFMLLLPLFKKQWRMAIAFLLFTTSLVLLPDVLKYAVTDSWHEASFSVPGSVIAAEETVPVGNFKAMKHSAGAFSYLHEHFVLNLSPDPAVNRWWQSRENHFNQSLYRIIASRLGERVPANYVLIGLCAVFAVLLGVLTRRRADRFFILGMLYYSAFVLIGPQSSKPHFIAFYGLLLFCWQDAFERRSMLKFLLLAAVSGLMGIKYAAWLIPDEAVARDIVGLAGFGLWLYSYVVLAVRGTRTRVRTAEP
jgi:hypothetical protein